MATTVQESFTAFFDDWFRGLQSLQEQLLAASQDANHREDHRNLVQRVLNHYQRYYEEKSKAMEEDVLLFFSPPWYSSLERTLFWVTGFRPSLPFMFSEGLDLTTEQAERIEVVKEKAARKEREIGEALAAVQESLAAAPLYGLANREERLIDGEVSELDKAKEEMKVAMRVVITEADALRVTVATGILEVLGVAQKVKFLAAASEFRLRARRVGLEMDAAGSLMT